MGKSTSDEHSKIKRPSYRRTKEILNDSIELVLSQGFLFKQNFCLIEKNGVYNTRDQFLLCHPLESVIIGLKVIDFINVQIASELNVTLDWVNGFIDAYDSKKPNNPYINTKSDEYWEYEKGHLGGKECQKFILQVNPIF